MSNQEKPKPLRGNAKLFASWDKDKLIAEQKEINKNIQQAVDANNRHRSKILMERLELVEKTMRDKGMTEEEISPEDEDIAW